MRRMAGKIVRLMKKHKIRSENELALRAGVTQPAVWRILKGESYDVSIHNLRKIAQALDTTTDYLLND